MSKTRIIILGGGYGGITAAKKLHREFKKKKDIQLTLIDRNPFHTLMTELHELAAARVETDSVKVNFSRIFSATSVEVITDDIKEIDFEEKRLSSNYDSYTYDYLIIGAGGAPEFFDIPGVQENSFTIWSFDDALRLRGHIDSCFRKASQEPDLDTRRRMLTFTIAGAGFTGIEMAGELIERKHTLCREFNIDENEVKVIIVETLDSILPIMPKKLQHKARKYLEKKGGEIITGAPVTGAEEGKITISEGREIVGDTFIWTCGIHGSEFTSRLPLTKGQTAQGECSYASSEGIHGMSGCRLEEDERYIVGERGRILVDDHMKSVDFDAVYLIGDIIWHLENEKVLPQIVETALQTAETAAYNVIADINNADKKKFTSNYHGFMVSIGSRYGVARVMGISLSGFFAMGMKHLINLHYLFSIAGFNGIWRYLRHEILDVKERRSFLGELFAYKIPNYWAVPLRLFLGVKWLLEGITHIKEGWINPGEEGLANVWTGAIKLPGVSFETADAASSATGQAAADAASGVAAGAAAEGAAQAAGHYSEPLIEALGIYTWCAEHILSASPLLAFLLQAGVVLGQVAIGLALIGGLFTFPAAVVSLGFSVMFIASGWGNPELLWYIAASIVMLGGAGRGLGLDHWVMPWIKKRWNSTGLAKKTYLYDGEPVE